MMYMSFTGIERNASAGVKELESCIEDLRLSDAIDEDDEFDLLAAIGNITVLISAYHDTILALLKGDTTVEQARDFWFHFEPEDVAKTPYKGGVLVIGKGERSVT